MAQPNAQQKETLSSTMMERIRRRLRKTAYRSHIVLQMVPEGDELHSHMHITPLRASRALALRFIATKFGLDMHNVMVGPAILPVKASLLARLLVNGLVKLFIITGIAGIASSQ